MRREREREKDKKKGFLNVHGWFVKYVSNCFLSNLEIEVWRDEIKNQRKKKSKDDDEFSKKPFDDD